MIVDGVSKKTVVKKNSLLSWNTQSRRASAQFWPEWQGLVVVWESKCSYVHSETWTQCLIVSCTRDVGYSSLPLTLTRCHSPLLARLLTIDFWRCHSVINDVLIISPHKERTVHFHVTCKYWLSYLCRMLFYLGCYYLNFLFPWEKLDNSLMFMDPCIII